MSLTRNVYTRYTTKAFDPARRIPPEVFAELETLLRFAPSSVNSQPWHFFIADDDAGKARIARATPAAYAYNEGKIRNASHVVVLAARRDLDDAHLAALLEQEDRDGRFATPEEIADAAGFGWTIPTAKFDWPTLVANKDKEIGRLDLTQVENLSQIIEDVLGQGMRDSIVVLSGPNLAPEIVRDPAVIALCERHLAEFLTDFMSKQPGVRFVPAVEFVYR